MNREREELVKITEDKLVFFLKEYILRISPNINFETFNHWIKSVMDMANRQMSYNLIQNAGSVRGDAVKKLTEFVKRNSSTKREDMFYDAGRGTLLDQYNNAEYVRMNEYFLETQVSDKKIFFFNLI